VVAVADAFDAMTSHRPYRSAMSLDVAFNEIAAKANTHFDPTCVEAFMRLRPAIEHTLRQEQAEEEIRDEVVQTYSRSELMRLMNRSTLSQPLVSASA
jgi:HD-GYP domain-containing protein (c-di-GMP phosphodiesterase class II)